MEVKLVVDGLEVQVGTEFLQDLVGQIPDTEDYTDLFLALAKSQNSLVRKEVAYKDEINVETAELLLADRDPDVLERILTNEAVKPVVTNDRLEEILGFAGTEVADNIICNMDDYEEVNCDVLADFIIAQDNPTLTLKLAGNYSLPKKILKKLAKSKDKDIKTAAKKSLE